VTVCVTGEKMFGVDRILSKCWNCCLAFNLSCSVTALPFISTTLGNLYTMKVRHMIVLETSFPSMVIEVSWDRTSSFEI